MNGTWHSVWWEVLKSSSATSHKNLGVLSLLQVMGLTRSSAKCIYVHLCILIASNYWTTLVLLNSIQQCKLRLQNKGFFISIHPMQWRKHDLNFQYWQCIFHKESTIDLICTEILNAINDLLIHNNTKAYSIKQLSSNNCPLTSACVSLNVLRIAMFILGIRASKNVILVHSLWHF